MKSKRALQVSIVIVIILAIVSASLGYLDISTHNELRVTNNNLLNTQNQLALTQSNLLSTQSQLTQTQSQLTDANNQLTQTQSQLTQTEGRLSDTENQLTITQVNLSDTQNQLTTSQGQLTTVQNQLALTQTNLLNTRNQLTQTQSQLADANNKLSAITGLPSPIIEIGDYFEWYEMVDGEYRSIVLIGNPNATNPTWTELKSFLVTDNTYKQMYVDPSFVCANFAEMLYFHAEKAGINAGYVNVKLGPYISGCGYSAGGFHACNVFNTTDRGLIFIDDTGTTDGTGEPTTVNVAIGTTYQPISIFSNTSWCPMGVVQDFNMVW